MTVKVQWEKLTWIALAIVLMVVGCSTGATQPTPVPPTLPPAPTATTALPFPTGIFAKASWTWELRADGTLTVNNQPTEYSADGVYTVTGNQVVIQDDSFTCKDVVGTYTWTYDGDVLTFTEVDDKCRDRAGVTSGKWRPKP